MDTQERRTFGVLPVLVGGLLVAVIVQSVVILGMHRKLDAMAGAQPERSAATLSGGSGAIHPQTALPPGRHDWGMDKDPFEWNLDEWDPFKEMHAMQDQINRMFGSAFGRFQKSDDFSRLFKNYAFSPDINLEDKGDRYLVTVDLPGAEDAQLNVRLEGQTLTIAGSVQSETKDEDKGRILKQERRSGSFRRTVTLPGPVVGDKMTTENRKGVLRIAIPKKTE